ncbi:MAG: hypothetical protein A2W93_04445 [Bacteroidetes bacterium GWF2_43_63]|nr:MAG: hypothetical protein A2W94_12435 [Bacteroidetes bacterium GWE2_42_42]OFY56012.1 MAG: hypothetical protein A2W93_04445 [Bacteroidetes bacterium GWF2_43_63]HBG70745.1 hypothetical protein [Bacteroidales bacterium]HCB62427.1 hypothetical protein [Bacteroidales bacterium]HCY21882.1 hypothetical protein [Bacteroidales bacterium]
MKIVEKNCDFVEFRKKFPVFTYESFDYRLTDCGISFSFHFHIGDEWHFRPASEIDFQHVPFLRNIPAADLDNLIFHIGMIELISYWKPTCSPLVEIKPYKLAENQIKWWKKLWYNGLGEFFYINSIKTTAKDFLWINSGEKELTDFEFQAADNFSTLVPIGGGKDSPVTLELIKNGGRNVIPLIINPRGATLNTVKMSGIGMEAFVSVKRTIDPTLLKMNDNGFLNGHTPFSAMLAFYTLLIARMTGISDIALSNESSANESTIPGTDVNHQYSKSFEFEQDFREYYAQNVSDGFNYFSFLRPLTELQIAKLFSQMTAYHAVFRSCNAGSKEDIWCGKCPKCLFANIILSPFLSPEKRIEIFGSDLYNNESLETAFEELTGKVPIKPFECVGTVSEVNEAIQLAIRKFYSKEKTLPYLLSVYEKWPDKPVSNSLHFWNKEHNLSMFYEKILHNVSGAE